MIEKLEGYKTIIFFAVSLLVALANLLGFGDFELTADQQEIILVVVSVAGLLLRYFTKTEVFKSQKG